MDEAYLLLSVVRGDSDVDDDGDTDRSELAPPPRLLTLVGNDDDRSIP